MNPVLSNVQTSQFLDPEFLTQLTLDASALINFGNINKAQLGSLELCTREYIHRIHVRRIRELKLIDKQNYCRGIYSYFVHSTADKIHQHSVS